MKIHKSFFIAFLVLLICSSTALGELGDIIAYDTGDVTIDGTTGSEGERMVDGGWTDSEYGGAAPQMGNYTSAYPCTCYNKGVPCNVYNITNPIEFTELVHIVDADGVDANV